MDSSQRVVLIPAQGSVSTLNWQGDGRPSLSKVSDLGLWKGATRYASRSRGCVGISTSHLHRSTRVSYCHGQTQEVVEKARCTQRCEEKTALRYARVSCTGSWLMPVPDTAFTCLFCHHDKSVTVRIDRKEGIAQLVCRVCDQRYQSKTNRMCPLA